MKPPDHLRAKLRCDHVTRHAGGAESAKLFAVHSGSDENKSFAKYTPAASFDITVDNPAAQNFFQPGAEYYFDISPAPKPEANAK